MKQVPGMLESKHLKEVSGPREAISKSALPVVPKLGTLDCDPLH